MIFRCYAILFTYSTYNSLRLALWLFLCRRRCCRQRRFCCSCCCWSRAYTWICSHFLQICLFHICTAHRLDSFQTIAQLHKYCECNELQHSFCLSFFGWLARTGLSLRWILSKCRLPSGKNAKIDFFSLFWKLIPIRCLGSGFKFFGFLKYFCLLRQKTTFRRISLVYYWNNFSSLNTIPACFFIKMHPNVLNVPPIAEIWMFFVFKNLDTFFRL